MNLFEKIFFLSGFLPVVLSYSYWWRYALMDVFYFERRGAYGRYLRQYPTHSPYVNKGIYKAVNECRELFKYNRWNCHSQNPHQPFGDVVDKGCRETAFVYALASAGLTFEMIHACSEGRIGCPKSCTEKVDLSETRLLNATHSLNKACNDDIRFGFRTWYDVVFEGERYSDIRAVFNIKNSMAGFKQIEKSSRLYCQCYGKSGSCIIRICSKRMPPTFKPIGKALYSLYEGAVYERPNQRTIENDASSLIRQRQSSRQTHVNQITITSEETPSLRSVNSVRRRRSDIFSNIRHLKFYERSPDFCRDPSYARDITNRVCLLRVTQKQSARGVKSCDQICCRGRDLRWVNRKVTKNCKFQYCCEVVCDEEVKWVKEYFCL